MVRQGLMVALVVLLAGCSQGDELPPSSNGKELYEFYCADCHGIAGEGRMLYGAPSTLGRGWSDEEIITWLLKPVNHQRMPVFNKMLPESARKIAYYLRSLEEE